MAVRSVRPRTNTPSRATTIAIAEKTGSPLLLKGLRSIRHKATLAFPPAHADRIRLLRRRILIGSQASEQLVADYTIVEPENAEHVSRAFFEMRRLRIMYRDTMRRITTREIEPQFLHLNLPAWYLLAWDNLRGDVRCFRLDRIRSAEVLNAGFRLRDGASSSSARGARCRSPSRRCAAARGTGRGFRVAGENPIQIGRAHV